MTMYTEAPPKNGILIVELSADDLDLLALACNEAANRLREHPEMRIAAPGTDGTLDLWCQMLQLAYYATKATEPPEPTNGTQAFEAAFVPPTE
jgi:hypothetical protein